ncbi:MULTISPECIES: SDR family oxidoreductase [Prochlorococcus]|uniref:SDR family oxidoreductase n=1 Tax=Prochlorococcus TaxID=1218 RepID=UPI00053380D9|nr:MULTISPECIES: SDR family oxidoreductase [Prochlorococcus]KGG12855.1 Sepiapterin reductase [Prochlorococcus sp. MIT 0601]
MPTVLITGASKGIGEATAKLFAKSGWDLLLVARNEKKLKTLSEELSCSGSKVFFKALDLSQPDQIAPGISGLLKNGLCPSVLINNAGIAWTGELISMPLEQWNCLMQVNLTSVFQVCSAVVPLMRANGGLIINVSSHASRNAFPQWGAYCISKAALVSFTKCLSEEEKINSIRACTLTLGSVNSSLWDSDDVKADFNRELMIGVDQVAAELFHLAQQPSKQVIEDMTLMPASGAF